MLVNRPRTLYCDQSWWLVQRLERMCTHEHDQFEHKVAVSLFVLPLGGGNIGCFRMSWGRSASHWAHFLACSVWCAVSNCEDCAVVGTVWPDWTGNGLPKVLDAPAQVGVHCVACFATIIFAIHSPCCTKSPKSHRNGNLSPCFMFTRTNANVGLFARGNILPAERLSFFSPWSSFFTIIVHQYDQVP